MYDVGEVTNDNKFKFRSKSNGNTPMDLDLEDMFESSPKTYMRNKSITRNYSNLNYNSDLFIDYLNKYFNSVR